MEAQEYKDGNKFEATFKRKTKFDGSWWREQREEEGEL